MEPESEPAARPVEVDGEVGFELDGKLYKVQRAKPWADMTEEEQKAYLEAGTRFIMGDD